MKKSSHKLNHKKYLLIFWLTFLIPLFIFLLLITGVALFSDLPPFEELENPKSNLASEIFSEDNIVLGKYYYQNRSNVHYKELSPNIIKALKATEDVRFEEHSGVDIRGLFRVMLRTIILRQSNAGGGSTISQQLAKNLFPRKKFETTWDKVVTKIKEWITSIRLERNYTKEEIMEYYLNTVEFGSNAFGIKSAARTFFSKAPSELTIEESAVLVGLLQAPTRYSPVKNPKNALNRRNVVLGQMEKYDFINEKQFDSLKVLPIKLKFQAEGHNMGLAPYFREYLRQDLGKWVAEHPKADGSLYNLYRDGLRIYTTIDSKMQQYAEEAIKEHFTEMQKQFFVHWKGKEAWGAIKEILVEGMKRSDRYISMKEASKSESEISRVFNKPIPMSVFTWGGDRDTVMSPMDSIKYYKMFLQAGFMSMDPHTGHVKAWVGGINYQHFKYDHVKEGRRQVGSTFKPFVYTVAMQEGLSPCQTIPNVPVVFTDEMGKKWIPENADDEDEGQMVTLKKALSLSINRVTAYLIKQYGPQAVIDVARKMGITSPIEAVPSICLGTPDISVFEMVGAYSVFANKGIWTEPTYITRIEDKNGNILQSYAPRKVEAIDEQSAYLMVSLLEGVVLHGTGSRLRFKYNLTQPMGGKTGTTQNHSDGWYMGITPDLVSGVWVGCEDRSVHFRNIAQGQGASMALPVWALYMKKVYADKNLQISQGDFEKPATINVETDCSKYKESKGSEETGGF